MALQLDQKNLKTNAQLGSPLAADAMKQKAAFAQQTATTEANIKQDAQRTAFTEGQANKRQASSQIFGMNMQEKVGEQNMQLQGLRGDQNMQLQGLVGEQEADLLAQKGEQEAKLIEQQYRNAVDQYERGIIDQKEMNKQEFEYQQALAQDRYKAEAEAADTAAIRAERMQDKSLQVQKEIADDQIKLQQKAQEFIELQEANTEKRRELKAKMDADKQDADRKAAALELAVFTANLNIAAKQDDIAVTLQKRRKDAQRKVEREQAELQAIKDNANAEFKLDDVIKAITDFKSEFEAQQVSTDPAEAQQYGPTIEAAKKLPALKGKEKEKEPGLLSKIGSSLSSKAAPIGKKVDESLLDPSSLLVNPLVSAAYGVNKAAGKLTSKAYQMWGEKKDKNAKIADKEYQKRQQYGADIAASIPKIEKIADQFGERMGSNRITQAAGDDPYGISGIMKNKLNPEKQAEFFEGVAQRRRDSVIEAEVNKNLVKFAGGSQVSLDELLNIGSVNSTFINKVERGEIGRAHITYLYTALKEMGNKIDLKLDEVKEDSYEAKELERLAFKINKAESKLGTASITYKTKNQRVAAIMGTGVNIANGTTSDIYIKQFIDAAEEKNLSSQMMNTIEPQVYASLYRLIANYDSALNEDSDSLTKERARLLVAEAEQMQKKRARTLLSNWGTTSEQAN